MQLDLSDDETAALTRLLRYTLDNPRYPLSPRLDPPQVHSRQARAAAAPRAAAAAPVRLVVWCRAYSHRAEPNLTTMADRYGADTPVRLWHKRLVCSACGSRDIDFVLTGARR